MEKSQKGKIIWITCYNNMQKKKSFEGNRIFQRPIFQTIKKMNNTPNLDVFVK